MEKIPLYHGTAKALGLSVMKEGLRPASELPPHFKSSHFTDRQKGHVFFFEKFDPAAFFGCSKARIVGMGPLASVFKTDSDKVKVTRDVEQKGPIAWKHKGTVPPELLEEIEIDCSKDKPEGADYTWFDRIDYVHNLTKGLNDTI